MSLMWLICDRKTAGAEKLNGYPSGDVYIVQREFPEETVEKCRKKAWNLVFEDGSEAELMPEYYVVDRQGELKGHFLDHSVILWYADFQEGGDHYRGFVPITGDLVRLGFGRW